MKSKKFLISIGVILTSIFIISSIVFAITKLSPSAYPASTFYSLDDIYNLVAHNTTKGAPNSLISTTTSPTATTSHSTSEIYALLANLVKQEKVQTGATILGVPGNYGVVDSNYSTTTASSSSLIPTGPLAIVKGYSLEDIYQLVKNNTKATAGSGVFPNSSSPRETMHTTSEVYTAITDLIASLNTNKTKFTGTILGVAGAYDSVTEGLVGYWPLDESSGSIAADLSGNGNNGTRFGASSCPITTDGAYTVHTFTSSGTFTPPAGVSNVQVLVVAGGGAGGGYVGGGGGGGGVIQQTVAVSGPQTVIVGAGGTYGNGDDSSFGDLVATGGGVGGVGGGDTGTGNDYPSVGGSGGGAGVNGDYTLVLGALGTDGQGYSGGKVDGNLETLYSFIAGGGGGASGPGEDGETFGNGNGGPGIASSISGTQQYYGGGGGGAVLTPRVPMTIGGIGGGGNGSGHEEDGWLYDSSEQGTAGTPSTGGGGGGGGTTDDPNAQFSGGSGIVIVRYLTPANPETCSPISGKVGTAYEFRDSQDENASKYVEIPNVSISDGTPISISFWGLVDSNSNGYDFFLGANPTGGDELSVGNANNAPVGLYNGGWNTSSINIADGQWHYYTVLLNDNGRDQLYVDNNIVVDVESQNKGLLPKITFGGNDYGALLGGKMDEVAIWNRTLSPTEITHLYNKGVAGTPLIPSN